eukprot:3464590-Prymnesium_polylepis.1
MLSECTPERANLSSVDAGILDRSHDGESEETAGNEGHIEPLEGVDDDGHEDGVDPGRDAVYRGWHELAVGSSRDAVPPVGQGLEAGDGGTASRVEIGAVLDGGGDGARRIV